MGNSDRFTKVPNWLQQIESYQLLPKSAGRVLIRLIHHRDYEKDIGRVGNARLMRETGFSERSIQYGMRALEACGIIKCWYRSDGKKTTRFYHVAMTEAQFQQHCIHRYCHQANKSARQLSRIDSNKGAINKGASLPLSHASPNKGADSFGDGVQAVAPLSELQEVRYKDFSSEKQKRQFKDILTGPPPRGLSEPIVT